MNSSLLEQAIALLNNKNVFAVGFGENDPLVENSEPANLKLTFDCDPLSMLTALQQCFTVTVMALKSKGLDDKEIYWLLGIAGVAQPSEVLNNTIRPDLVLEKLRT